MPLQLLIIRHGIAEQKEIFKLSNKPDELRPLTERGRKKMRANAEGLSKVVGNITLVATSPLTRAKQTAEIILRKFKKANVIELSELIPEAQPLELKPWLRKHHKKENTIALVGHEPHLSQMVSYFVSGRSNPPVITLKKGGVCLLEFGDKVEKGCAKLVFLVQPSELQKIAKQK